MLPDIHIQGRSTLYIQSDYLQPESLAICDPDDFYSADLAEFRIVLLYLGNFSSKTSVTGRISAALVLE